jgi:hypothetical protein
MDELPATIAARFADLLPASERDRYLADVMIATALLNPGNRFEHLAYLMYKTRWAYADAFCGRR